MGEIRGTGYLVLRTVGHNKRDGHSLHSPSSLPFYRVEETSRIQQKEHDFKMARDTCHDVKTVKPPIYPKTRDQIFVLVLSVWWERPFYVKLKLCGFNGLFENLVRYRYLGPYKNYEGFLLSLFEWLKETLNFQTSRNSFDTDCLLSEPFSSSSSYLGSNSTRKTNEVKNWTLGEREGITLRKKFHIKYQWSHIYNLPPY